MLVTLATIKTYLGITGTAQDALLELFEGQMVALLSSLLQRNLESTVYTNEVLVFQFSKFNQDFNRGVMTGSTYGRIRLKNTPITAFTSVTHNGDIVDASRYNLDLATGIIQFKEYFDDTDQKLKANYTAGYTDATLPKDLQMVLLEAIKKQYQSSGTAKQSGSGRDVKSKKIGEFSVSYSDDTQLLWQSQFSNVLKKYKYIAM